MMEILIKDLIRLQIEYKSVLLNAQQKLYSVSHTEVINEVCIFWHRNRRLVECALNWLSVLPYETSVFTAAVNLDYEDKDYLPFLMHRRRHILDDPVSKFALTQDSNKILGDEFSERVKENIQEAIIDNLRIIENLEGIVFILPVSYIFIDSDEAFRFAENYLCEMFDDSISCSIDYHTCCSTFEDALHHLKPKSENLIVLNGIEDSEIDIEERFKLYCENTRLFESGLFRNEAEVLWFGLFSEILSASSIYLFCRKYLLTPFIRYDVVHTYFSQICEANLLSSAEDINEISVLLTYSYMSFVTNRVLVRELFNDIDINTFIKSCREYDFNTKIIDKMASKKCSIVLATHDVIREYEKTFKTD